jgi:hypothetical protein
MSTTKTARVVFQKIQSNHGFTVTLAILMSTILLSLGGCHDPSIELVDDSHATTHVNQSTHVEDEHDVADHSVGEHTVAEHSGDEHTVAEHSGDEHSGDVHSGDVHAEATHLPDSDAAAAEIQDTRGALDQPQDPEPELGVLGKAGSLLKQATAQGSATANGASKWVQDKLGSAADAGGRTAEDTMNWANETFEMLKAKGLTTASNTTQWLSEDWSNMESWEYKVVTLGAADEGLTKALNDFGKQGWECFETESKPGGTRFFFKRPTFSYLRHLPFRDVIKLAPLMNNGEK